MLRTIRYIFRNRSVFTAVGALLVFAPLARSQQGGFSGRVTRDDPPPLAQKFPEALQDVGVVEHLDGQLPLDATFTDPMGRTIQLRDCLKPGKPAILQLGYFGCPMLCDQVSQGMLDTVNDLDLKMGEDYTAIYISIDPKETYKDAYKKKQALAQRYVQGGAGQSWNFLVGDQQTVKRVADAAGFKYKWVDAAGQFSHPAVLMVLTPEGKVARYLYGIKYDQRTLRLSLVEASAGKIGTSIDQVLMLCFQYDAHAGKYTLFAKNLMMLAGAVTVVGFGSILFGLLYRERRARLREAADVDARGEDDCGIAGGAPRTT